jgi:hypothetical protein
LRNTIFVVPDEAVRRSAHGHRSTFSSSQIWLDTSVSGNRCGRVRRPSGERLRHMFDFDDWCDEAVAAGNGDEDVVLFR